MRSAFVLRAVVPLFFLLAGSTVLKAQLIEGVSAVRAGYTYIYRTWNAANAYQLKGNMTKANELRDKAKQLDPGIGN